MTNTDKCITRSPISARTEYKTGRIVPTSLLSWAQNSLFLLLVDFYPCDFPRYSEGSLPTYTVRIKMNKAIINVSFISNILILFFLISFITNTPELLAVHRTDFVYDLPVWALAEWNCIVVGTWRSEWVTVVCCCYSK